MTRLTLPSLAFLFAAGLAGCSSMDDSSKFEAQDLTPAKAPQVNHLRLEYIANFAPGSAELAQAETNRLEAFLAQSQVRPSERLYLSPAAGDRLAAARIGRIVKALVPRGIAAQTIMPPPKPVAPDHLLVVIDRYVVTPPPCPDWSQSPTDFHGNTPSSNFGCATMTNLSLMVDDPRDLVTGRTPGPAGAEPALEAVARYRNGAVKSLGGGSGGGGGAPAAAPAAPSPAP